jgi:hypothetical protein
MARLIATQPSTTLRSATQPDRKYGIHKRLTRSPQPVGEIVARADVPNAEPVQHASIDQLWAYGKFEPHLQHWSTLAVISVSVTRELPFPDPNDDISG